MSNRRLVITDPGIDDLICLALLDEMVAQKSERISYLATYGNSELKHTSNNLMLFSKLANNIEDIYLGSSLPLDGTMNVPWPDYFHGDDGKWSIFPDNISIENSIVREFDYNDKFDSILSLGPLTDLLYIQRKYQATEIVVMGGAFNVEGNETIFAETNIAIDIPAAKEFFDIISEEQIIKIVPLDVTRKAYWTIDQINNIPETSQLNIWLKNILLTWNIKYNHEREQFINLHDPLAGLLYLCPELVKWKSVGCKINISNHLGRTEIADNQVQIPLISNDEGKYLAKLLYNKIFLKN